jgi:hypothetical protein
LDRWPTMVTQGKGVEQSWGAKEILVQCCAAKIFKINWLRGGI